MSSHSDFASLHSEIERLIGRNLLLYQRIELILKELDRLSRISGTIEELPEVIAKAHHRSNRHTLGGAASRFAKQAASTISEDPVDLKGDSFHLALHWNIEEDTPSRQAREERIRKVVADRNRLAHGILIYFDLTLPQGCEDLMSWLDSAHESAHKLAGEVNEILEGMSLLFSLLMDPEISNLELGDQKTVNRRRALHSKSAEVDSESIFFD